MSEQDIVVLFNESQPFYYLGWLIQPTINRFCVCDRCDRDIIGMKKNAKFFDTIENALQYINSYIRAV